MTLLEFAQKINLITEKSALKEAIVCFVNTPPNMVVADEEKKIELFVDSISRDSFTSFGQNLGFCRNYCLEELNNDENREDIKYTQKITQAKDTLDTLAIIYQKVIEKRASEKSKCEDPYTLEQQRDVLRELVNETKKLQSDLDKANEDIKEANKSLDGKIFSLLTNTVAILGIFVAIAFTGLGTMSIFSNIDLKTAIQSTSAFVKNIFFILLVSTLVYNLLIVLVYFIYKLSRPMSNSTDTGEKQTAFSTSLPLRPFLWVDGGHALLTAGAFIASLFVQ